MIRSLAILPIVFVLGFTVPAHGRPNIVYDKERYTLIGTYDEHLSRLCAMGLFNQRSQFLHSAYFKRDKVKLGAATGNGWNLRDPTGARRYPLDYWFRADGFSTCQVFRARNKSRDAAAAGTRR